MLWRNYSAAFPLASEFVDKNEISRPFNRRTSIKACCPDQRLKELFEDGADLWMLWLLVGQKMLSCIHFISFKV